MDFSLFLSVSHRRSRLASLFSFVRRLMVVGAALFCAGMVLIVGPVQAQPDRVVNDGTGNDGGSAPSACSSPDNSSIDPAITDATAGNTILVCPGTYTEQVTIGKSIVLNGANDGTDGNGSRINESIVDGGNGIAFEITTTAAVTVDGFQFEGDRAVVRNGSNGSHSTITIRNNRFRTDEFGVRLRDIQADGGINVTDNFTDLTSQIYTKNSSEAGATGIALRTIDGSGSVTVSGNDFQDGSDSGSGAAWYGVVFDGVKVSSGDAVITGGSSGATMQDLAQAVAILDGEAGEPIVNTSGGQTPDESDFAIQGGSGGLSASSFTGESNNGAISFHAGVFVYAGGSPGTQVKTTGNISNVTITGTRTANGTGNSSAGLYLGGFSTEFGSNNGNFDQEVTVTNVTVQDNANRGVYARGADVVATVTQSTITGNGDAPTDPATGNRGLGVVSRKGADLTVTESEITNPASMESGFTASSDFGSALQSTATLTVNSTDYPSLLTVTNSKIDRNGLDELLSGSDELRAAENAFVSGGTQLTGSDIANNSDGSSNDFNPYLSSTSDTDGGTPGFQGDFSGVTVTTAGDQLGSLGTNQRIADGIGSVNTGGTVTVESGPFTENVTVGKSVTLQGNNAGTAGYASRTAETVVDAGTATFTDAAITIQADDVTVDGFRFIGSQGVELDGSDASSRSDWAGATIENNLVETNIRGIRIQKLNTTSSRNFTIQNNQFAIQQQLFDQDGSSTAGDATGEETSSVEIRAISDGGSGTRPTIQENVITTDGDDDSGGGTNDGSFYGYEIDGLKITAGKTTIAGDPNNTGNTGTIQGTAQGIAVLDGQTSPQSDIAIEDFSISMMSGSAPDNGAVNFQAGVFTYTARTRNDGTTDVRIANTTVEGLDFSDPYVDGNQGANASANIYLSNFDFDTSTIPTHNVTVAGVTVQNTEHRGISVAGGAGSGKSAADDINATITDASGTNTVVKGVQPGSNGTGGQGDGHALHSEDGGSPVIKNATVTNSSTSGAGALHVRPSKEPATVTIGTNVVVNSAGQNTFEDQGASGSESTIEVTDAANPDLVVDGFQQSLSSGNAALNVRSGTDFRLEGVNANTQLQDLDDSQVTLNAAPILGSGTHEAASTTTLTDLETQNTGTDPSLTGAGALRITGLLTLQSGTFDVTGGTLTLASTSETSTAAISSAGSGSVNGNVVFERFLDKSDDASHFRMLSAPTATLLDDEGSGSNDGNLLSNTWTQTTSGSDTGADGEGVTDASVFTYDESQTLGGDPLSAAWTEVANLNSGTGNFNPGTGFMAYMFEDRDFDSNNEGFPITLTATGSVQSEENSGSAIDLSGQITFTDDSDANSDNGWNLIANPFMAPIDWESIENDGAGLDNVDATIYVYDPADGSYDTYMADGNGTNGTVNGQDRYIAPFQAFFVKANGSTPNIGGIDGGDKATGTSPEFKQGPKQRVAQSPEKSSEEKADEAPKTVRLRLRSEDGSQSGATVVRYADGAAARKDAYDAYQLKPPFSASYAVVSSQIEGMEPLFDHQTRPLPGEKDTVDLALDVTANGSYTVGASALEDIPDDWSVVLENTETGARYDLTAGEVASFTYEAKAATKTTPARSAAASASGPTRLGDVSPTVMTTSSDTSASGKASSGGSLPSFRLLIGSNAALPVELAEFEGQTVRGAVRLSWNTASERNNAGFRVQRSLPGTENWTTLGFVEGHGTTTTPQNYQFTDEDLPYAAESVSYRLRQIDTDGTMHLSDPIEVRRGPPSSLRLRSVFPNPTRSEVTMRYEVPSATHVSIGLYDTLGRRVARFVDEEVEAGRKAPSFSVASLPPGVYFVRFRAEQTHKVRKLVIVR